MKKTGTFLLVLVAIVVLWGVSTYNKLTKAEEQMTEAWSQVENVYQRRMELIPSLLSVVKSYSDYENKALVEIVESRAMTAAAVQVNAESPTQEQLTGFDQAQQQLGTAVNEVILSVENYPDLKAVESYHTFLTQYAGSENRILVERQRFNETVQQYNSFVKKFPSKLIANLFGFEEHAYFS